MIAVVTGASKGIGKAITIMLAQQGYKVYALARGMQALTQLQAASPGHIIPCTVDLANADDINSFLVQHSTALSQAALLVNNAGAYLPGNFNEQPAHELDYMYNVNLKSAYILSQALAKNMALNGRGHIFNICSISSKKILQNISGYTVTKAAMYSLNNVLRKQLAPQGIKVTAVLPAQTFTDSWVATGLPAEKFVQPEDIAAMLKTVLSLSANTNVDEITITPLNF